MSFDVFTKLQAMEDRIAALENQERIRSFSEPMIQRFMTFKQIARCSNLSEGVLKFHAIRLNLYDPEKSPRGRRRSAGLPWSKVGELLASILHGPKYESAIRRVSKETVSRLEEENKPRVCLGCFVYIFEGKNSCKIGVSESPRERLKSIATNRGDSIKIAKQYQLRGRPQAYRLESALHKVFADKRTFGEWFAASAAEIIKKADEIYERHLLVDDAEQQNLDGTNA